VEIRKKGMAQQRVEKEKRELRKELRKLKKDKISREEYVGKRREYKKWCAEEKKKHEQEEEKRIRAIKTKAWKYINKHRRKRERVNRAIDMNSWSGHFMELLGGTKEKVVMEEEEREQKEEGNATEKNKEKEKEITKEELVKQLRKRKKEKAPGENGIENEAWRLMPGAIGEVFWKLVIWKDGGIPEEWNRGIISPIFKKGEKSDVKNYRGVTLMDTAYKIYANILNERLKREVEGKLEEGQFGFREGRGTMDAIYILNYMVNKETAKKKGKIYAFFADLKAAFDKVNRVKLREMLRKANIEEQLRRRVMETYMETKNKVKVGNEKSEEFWTRSRVRQGCPISPTLFNIFLMDLETEMRKEQLGGVVVGKEKVWSIIYADDIVLLAKSEQELKNMMSRFKKYLRKKELMLSPEKSKVVVFEKGKGKTRKREWKWGEEKIEEVKEIRYLGYIMQKNGGAEKHVVERMRRSMIAMKQTWSIGERLFKEDYRRRMMMYNALVGSVALYGAEIWGWKKEERLDKITRKYVKWILGLDRRTPNYIVKEETKMKELRLEAIRRAVKYEEEARQSKKKLVVECIKEMEKEGRKRRREQVGKVEERNTARRGDQQGEVKREERERRTEGDSAANSRNNKKER